MYMYVISATKIIYIFYIPLHCIHIVLKFITKLYFYSKFVQLLPDCVLLTQRQLSRFFQFVKQTMLVDL